MHKLFEKVKSSDIFRPVDDKEVDNRKEAAYQRNVVEFEKMYKIDVELGRMMTTQESTFDNTWQNAWQIKGKFLRDMNLIPGFLPGVYLQDAKGHVSISTDKAHISAHFIYQMDFRAATQKIIDSKLTGPATLILNKLFVFSTDTPAFSRTYLKWLKEKYG